MGKKIAELEAAELALRGEFRKIWESLGRSSEGLDCDRAFQTWLEVWADKRQPAMRNFIRWQAALNIAVSVDAQEKADLCRQLRERGSQLSAAIGTYNGTVKQAYAKLSDAVAEYNKAADRCNDYIEEGDLEALLSRINLAFVAGREIRESGKGE